jgi:hypothetical protein
MVRFQYLAFFLLFSILCHVPGGQEIRRKIEKTIEMYRLGVDATSSVTHTWNSPVST